MNDPARQERIQAAADALTEYESGLDPADARLESRRALEAADAIEPRPVYLTAEERALALEWLPDLWVPDVPTPMEVLRDKLQAAQVGK